jgi:hypothetical protein
MQPATRPIFSYGSRTSLMVVVNVNAVTRREMQDRQQEVTFNNSIDSHLPKELQLSNILRDFRATFNGIGCVKGVEVDVQLQPDAVRVCHPPSRVALHLRQAVVNELEHLLQCGIIECVSQPSAWVSRMVVVPKGAVACASVKTFAT